MDRENSSHRPISVNASGRGWSRVSTSDFPERDRFPIFCEEMFRCTAALDLVRRGSGPYSAAFEQARVGPVDLSLLSTSPSHYGRTKSLLRDGQDRLVTFLNIRSPIQINQGPEPQRMAAGQAAIADLSEVGELVVEDGSLWCVQILRKDLAGLVPHIDRFAGMRLKVASLM